MPETDKGIEDMHARETVIRRVHLVNVPDHVGQKICLGECGSRNIGGKNHIDHRRDEYTKRHGINLPEIQSVVLPEKKDRNGSRNVKIPIIIWNNRVFGKRDKMINPKNPDEGLGLRKPHIVISIDVKVNQT
jgi:hypothetical protein